MTCTLLTTSEGKKMGKTQNGALWLDPEKTSPYEFYQYWRNVQDADVKKCLSLLTFVPMDKVNELCAVEGSAINEAKKVLAYEVTKLIHGEEEAKKAMEAAEALFAGGNNMNNVPTVEVSREKLNTALLDILTEGGVIPSKAEGKRIIKQNGLSLNDEKVTDIYRNLVEEDFTDGIALVKKGKKSYHKLQLV